MKHKNTTKEKIADAAWELFSERGYAYVSMQDIAEAVGMQKPSLYHHFKSREEMTGFIIEGQFKKMEYLMSDQGVDFGFSMVHVRAI